MKAESESLPFAVGLFPLLVDLLEPGAENIDVMNYF